MKKKYRIDFLKNGRYGSDAVASKDVLAENKEEAFKLAYRFRDNNPRAVAGADEISVTEIPDGVTVIGIEFEYRNESFKRNFHDYDFIRAKDEASARDYYNTHLKGRRFKEGKSNILDETGWCIKGKIIRTYYVDGARWDFDATKDNGVV